MNNKTNFNKRYNRHIVLDEIGIDGQKKLLNSNVLVIGAGGLGSSVLSYLAAAGVGNITIFDDDIVDISNLQRQVIYNETDIGFKKVEAAKQNLLKQNSSINIETYFQKFSKSIFEKIKIKYDVIVDCTDNFESRYIIDEFSFRYKIPMVYGSISKFEGQLAVFNLNKGRRYIDLFPDMPQNKNSVASRGVLGVLPGIIGSIQANEVIKIICGINGVLENKLFTINAKSMQSNIVQF